MSRITSLVGALAGAGLAACSIPNTSFHASPDAASGGSDAMTNVLAIRTSVASFDVDEGGTTSFTVQLSQAPSAELVVRIAAADSASTASIGISVPELRFEPTNFDQPQSVMVTGLVDADTADALANISLTGDGVDPVTVAATVRDHDKVAIATDIVGNTLLINEGSTATIHVHLTHQPPADVRVTAALGAGPVTVSPAQVTFTAGNYNVDQTFTFTAPEDINIVSEDESLALQMAGAPDQLYTIHDTDNDTLNIHATPTTLSVNEGGSAQVSVTLTQQPPANTTVHVDLQLGNVSIDHTDLTFTLQNFSQAQVITVSAPQDANTVNEQDQLTLSIPGSGVSNVTIGVTTIDDDVQAILEDAPNPLSVTENQMAKFGVTLKFQPTTTVTVAVTSANIKVATASPGALTFTPQNYNIPQQVTVTGADDNNLATDSTHITLHEPTLVDVLVPVNVPDDDTQSIVVSTTSLTVPEGMTGSFTVALKFDPGTTVAVNLSDTNPTSLPIDKTSITFTGGPNGTWQTPVPVTVSPPVDINNVGEMATITVSGAGALSPATVTAMVMDSTVVKQYGFPMPFTSTASLGLGEMIAYKITTDATVTLDSFGVYIPAGTGDFRMALYADGLNAPGALVASMPVRQAISNGINTGSIPGVNLPIGTYWIAFRAAQTTAVGFATAGTGPECVAVQNISNLDSPWPSSFGTANCANDNFMNFFITTHHQ